MGAISQFLMSNLCQFVTILFFSHIPNRPKITLEYSYFLRFNSLVGIIVYALVPLKAASSTHEFLFAFSFFQEKIMAYHFDAINEVILYIE